MASKIESSEESNTPKYGPPSILSRPLPILASLQQPIASSSCTRRDQILAPLQDDRGRKPRDIESNRTKGALYFSVPVEQPPTIVTDQEYIARKKTFDTFLKSRDIEFMMGGKGGGGGQNPRTLERHSSLDQVKNSQSKSQKELKSTLRNKGGKMFTNELWSDGYYASVINSSNLKKKNEQKSALMLKPLQQKAQELESLCNTVQTSKQKTTSYFFTKNPSFDVTQTMREAFQPLEFSSLYQTPDASPAALPKGKSALRSILKNITPRKGSADKLIGSQSTELNPKDLTPDFSPNFMLSDAARSFHLPKPYKRPQNLHISFDKKYEEEGNSMTSETLSPIVPPKSKRTLHQGGFLASISSKFSTAKNQCALSNSSKNSRRERSDEADTFEAVSETLRQESGYNLQLKNAQSSPENIEARQKMQQLINQCIDLGQKNKDLEKEVMSTKADFEAFTNRRQKMRLQLQKTMELSERLNRQTKFIKVLYNQKQGSS